MNRFPDFLVKRVISEIILTAVFSLHCYSSLAPFHDWKEDENNNMVHAQDTEENIVNLWENKINAVPAHQYQFIWRIKETNKKLRGLSPRATAACWRS
jgi:hypothetical protein